jgi:hypothetical protein
MTDQPLPPDRADPYVEWKTTQLGPGVVNARYRNYPGSYTLHWGDGTSTLATAPDRYYSHVYGQPGSYMLAIELQTGGGVQQYTPLWVRSHVKPVAEIAAHPELGAPTMRLTFGQDGHDWMISQATVNWGDETEAETVRVGEGLFADHTYTPGTYTVTIADLLTKRTLSLEVDASVPPPDPTFEWSVAGDDPTRMTVLAKVTAAEEPERPIRIEWWDDSAEPFIDPVEVGTEYRHTFPAGHTGEQTFAYGYRDGAFLNAVDVTLPFPETA